MRLRFLSLSFSLVVAASLSACAPAPSTTQATADAGDGGAHEKLQLDCINCHAPEYRGARHHVGERPTTCTVCHAQTGWHPTRMAHPWPLTGKHEKAKCFACHEGDPPRLAGTPSECVDCHKKDYDGAPNHAGRFPTTCATCHTTSAWKPTLPHEWHAEPEPKPEPKPEPTASATTSASAAKAPPKKPPPKKPPKKPPTPTPTPDDWPNVITGGSRR